MKDPPSIRQQARAAREQELQEQAKKAEQDRQFNEREASSHFASEMRELYGIDVPAGSLRWEAEGLVFRVESLSSEKKPHVVLVVSRPCGHEHQIAVGGYRSYGVEPAGQLQWQQMGRFLDEVERGRCPECEPAKVATLAGTGAGQIDRPLPLSEQLEEAVRTVVRDELRRAR